MTAYSALLLWANNAQTTLANSISNTSLTANLASGSGSLFPAPGAGQAFVGTFKDAATGLLTEVVLVTNRTGDTITMTRAQEGTTGLNWSANDLFANLVTMGTMQTLVQLNTLQTQSTNYGTDTGVVNAYIAAFTPVIGTAPAAGTPLRVKIKAGNTNTAASTLDCGWGAVNVVRRDGSDLIGGELVAGMVAQFVWNGASMEWQGIAPATDAAAVAGVDTQSAITPAQAAALLLTVTGLPSGFYNNKKSIWASNTTRTLTADTFVVSDGSTSVRMAAVNRTLNSALSGAGGLDTGSLAINTIYYEYIIWGSAHTSGAAIMSLSPTAPTLPAGYTHWGRFSGAAITNAGTSFYNITQKGDDAQYIVGSSGTTTTMPLVAGGGLGQIGNLSTSGASTFAAIDLSKYVPATATKASFSTNNAYAGGSSTFGAIAPNGNYTSPQLGSPPPQATLVGQWHINFIEMQMEVSQTIYGASQGSPYAVFVLGWKDPIN